MTPKPTILIYCQYSLIENPLTWPAAAFSLVAFSSLSSSWLSVPPVVSGGLSELLLGRACERERDGLEEESEP